MIWKKIKLIFSRLGDFLIEFLESGSSVTICEIGPFTLEIVLRAENLPVRIKDSKREYVFGKLKETFPTMAPNELYTAIEMAVVLMKKKGLEKKSGAEKTAPTRPEPAGTFCAALT